MLILCGFILEFFCCYALVINDGYASNIDVTQSLSANYPRHFWSSAEVLYWILASFSCLVSILVSRLGGSFIIGYPSSQPNQLCKS